GMALDVNRTYSSTRASQDSPLGFGWTDSYNMSLSIDQLTGDLTIHQENASEVTFTPDGMGGYSPPPYVLATLIQDGNATFTFKRDQTQAIFTFDPSGELIAETDRNGYVTFLAYSGGELATVADPAGRSLTFT